MASHEPAAPISRPLVPAARIPFSCTQRNSLCFAACGHQGTSPEVDDPVWDELETLGLVEIRVVQLTAGGSPTRCGMLTSLGRRYRTE